jgi:serine-type D-Ala-D-Ala carboxypeptidase (penicillin-binding protein 5/6)
MIRRMKRVLLNPLFSLVALGVSLGLTSCITTPGGISGSSGTRYLGQGGSQGAPQQAPLPGGSVGAYMVVETQTSKILAFENAKQKRQIGSLAKVATAVVVLDWAKGVGADLSQLITIPNSAAVIGGENPVGMVPGDQISIRDALYASMMVSDNVSAEALATHVGLDLARRQGRAVDPVQHFVAQMNGLAGRLSMTDTKFTNAHGLDHNSKPYSTAADLARLASHAVTKGSFLFYTGQVEREIGFVRAGQTKRFAIGNTNTLAGRDGIDGVKTGLTATSGPCLILSSAKQPVVQELPDGRMMVTPRRIIVVVLGAQDRFGRANGLLQQGWASYERWYAAQMPVYAPEEMLPNF